MKEIEILGIDEIIYYGKCDNGLKVYVWVNDKVDTVNMSLAVKYGSIHTDFASNGKKIKVPNGTAHFLEHLKFNEENNVTAHEFFAKTGAEVNAFTTFDFTSYYVIAIDKIEENLLHLLDFVQKPYFTKDLVNKEKGIILEETKMGMDSPDTVSYFGIFENLFNSSNYKNLITGTLKDVKNISLEDIENIYNNFYHPENMALFVTGNVNPHEIKMIVNTNQNIKEFGKYLNPKVITPKEKVKVNELERTIEGNVTEPRVKIGVKMLKKTFENYSEIDIRIYINLILSINFGSTSELNDYLVENHLASKLSASCDIYDDYVIIVAAANTKYPEEVSKILNNKLRKLVIDKAEFNRKIKAAVATFILNYDSVEKVNDIMQDDYINYDKIIDNVKTKYENLSLKKLEKFLELLNFDNITNFIMKPKKED